MLGSPVGGEDLRVTSEMKSDNQQATVTSTRSECVSPRIGAGAGATFLDETTADDYLENRRKILMRLVDDLININLFTQNSFRLPVENDRTFLFPSTDRFVSSR